MYVFFPFNQSIPIYLLLKLKGKKRPGNSGLFSKVGKARCAEGLVGNLKNWANFKKVKLKPFLKKQPKKDS
ncbi:MAG: hypothetical protein COW89_01815 [Nitrospinae bacterium CG22_combo_CG10-13_8_21_14_all_47_10]|nr:MAG: hypothetical protein COW89_01815 [Nitrospinae bacterium CG22_combo_CG10-13_8_21_14_all_47_10]